MRILFKNAKNGAYTNAFKFFDGNDYEFIRADITLAQVEGGVKKVIDLLKKTPNFKGKIIGGGEDTLNHKTFIKLTLEQVSTKARYSEDTGEFLEEVEVKEDYNYLMIINHID